MNDIAPNAYLRRVVHAMCLGGASTLSLTAPAARAEAAPADTNSASDAELSEIVVTGIRASLQQSLDIKRNSDGIVDAISA